MNQLGRQVFGRGFAAGSAEQGRQVTQAGQLDVEELGLAVLKHHHVARAHRTVDEPHVVQRLHGAPEIERPPHRDGDVERAILGEHVAEPASLDELHHGEGPALLDLSKRQHAGQRRVGRRHGDD